MSGWAKASSTSTSGPAIITSFEPDERWFYDYRSSEFFAGPTLPAPTLIGWTYRCPDQQDKYLQTGKRCSTNRKPKIGLLCGEHAMDFGHDGGALSHGCRDALRRTRSHITYRENADPMGL